QRGLVVDTDSYQRPNYNYVSLVFYLLLPVTETIVHKRHITFPLSAAKLARTKAQFFTDEPWDLDVSPGYSEEERANPFLTFAAIPAKARYQFMLDEAEYFTRTFIRGPVCRGQIATDVIRDHFWAFFVAPEKDLFITDKQHRDNTTPYLALAGQNDKLTSA